MSDYIVDDNALTHYLWYFGYASQTLDYRVKWNPLVNNVLKKARNLLSSGHPGEWQTQAWRLNTQISERRYKLVVRPMVDATG